MRLHLYSNDIGKGGAVAIAKGMQEWAFPSCTQVELEANPVDKRAIRFVTDSIKRREWARVVLRLWRKRVQAEVMESHSAQVRHGSYLSTGARRNVTVAMAERLAHSSAQR